jgi:hypothetical protein
VAVSEAADRAPAPARSENEADGNRLQADIVAIGRELGDPALSAAARESKTATLALLKRRAENVARRRQTLEEIASDLARIEAQVALVLENTTLEGKPQAISSDLELASQLLDGTQFAVACLRTRTGLSANGRG